jgi:ribosomal-protein-alanine N-acetyltransferase
MHYRLYRPGDFPQLYAIEQECFQPPFRFPRRYMQQLLANQNSAAWVADEDQHQNDHQMTGFAIANWAQHGAQTIAYIQTIEVAPAHRKQGIATELLSRIESSATVAGARLLWLHVAETNTPAIALYQAHGYRPKGREENFYAPDVNALIYFKSLDLPK